MRDLALRSLEDLSANEWITPLEKFELQIPRAGADNVSIVIEPNGTPLQVMAVDVPFLVVRNPWGVGWAMDGRKIKVKRLSPEYVAAALAAMQPLKTA